MKTFIKFLKEVIYSLIIGFFVAVIVTQYILIPASIEGNSMEPNLKDESYVILGKFTLFNGIERFKIVTIEDNDTNIIKRVIGLPNEKIEYIDNKLYVNDVPLEEDFEIKGTTKDFSIQLKEDEYFCMGDNREHSTDSRVYGPFSKSDIKSESVFLQIDGK